MTEFYIDTNKVKFVPTEVGLYLRRYDSKDYFYVRLPIDTIWSHIKDTTLMKIKVDKETYNHFRLKRFAEKINEGDDIYSMYKV